MYQWVIPLSSCKDFPFDLIINFVWAGLNITIIWIFEGPDVFAQGSTTLAGPYPLMSEVCVVSIFPVFPRGL